MRRFPSANAQLSSFMAGLLANCSSDEASKVDDYDHVSVVRSFLPRAGKLNSSQPGQHNARFHSVSCSNISGSSSSSKDSGAMSSSPHVFENAEPLTGSQVDGGISSSGDLSVVVDANTGEDKRELQETEENSVAAILEEGAPNPRAEKRGQRAEEKERKEMKAARAKAYEERWRERCAQELNDDTTMSGWKQPLRDEYGGWAYTTMAVAIGRGKPDNLATNSSWKQSLRPEKEFGGWDQPFGEGPIGGWLSPPPVADDYQTQVEILGKKVMVTVATKGATVERWLEGRKDEATWGLDIEWRPTFQKGDYHFAALLQLCLEECCLLIQLQFIDVLPESLKSLLANPRIKMGGVGIKADTSKLRKDFNLVCAGEVELTTLAVSTLKNTALKKTGIATLTEAVLGIPFKKNKRATMSNWENRELTYAQIQYAAADAWLSYSILIALLNYKEKPAVPDVEDLEEQITPV